MRYVELRRHTDNDGDELTAQGVADAEVIGREGLQPPYAAFVSSGAARATRMLTILRHAAGQDESPISEVAGLRSTVEDRWRAAAKAAGRGATVEEMREVDPDLDEGARQALSSLVAQQAKVIATPHDGLDAPLVVSAWGRQLELDDVADPRLQQFIDLYRNSGNAPEPYAACQGAGEPAVAAPAA